MLKKLAVAFVKAKWGTLLPAVLKAAAEGQFGEPVRKAYWFAAGKKTVTGAVVVGLSAGFAGVCGQFAEFPWACTASRWATGAGVILAGLGLLDGAYRAQAPIQLPPKP